MHMIRQTCPRVSVCFLQKAALQGGTKTRLISQQRKSICKGGQERGGGGGGAKLRPFVVMWRCGETDVRTGSSYKNSDRKRDSLIHSLIIFTLIFMI